MEGRIDDTRSDKRPDADRQMEDPKYGPSLPSA